MAGVVGSKADRTMQTEPLWGVERGQSEPAAPAPSYLSNT
jgi:hypothetical protein